VHTEWVTVEPRNRFIGIDVGGTKIMGVVADAATGEIQARRKAPTPKDDPKQLPIAINDVVADLITEAGRPVGIGVGVPGLVDHQGVLQYGPNVPGVLGLDIAGELRAAFSLPAIAENDATCAALAEHRLGAAMGTTHAIVINQGTGIAGGIIIGGRMHRGANGFAGEPGHMLINASGHDCACGKTGCWEAVASGAGLANIARDVVAEGMGARIVELAGNEPAHIRGEHVSAAMAEGDPGAAEVTKRFVWWVAEGLANLIALLDPEVIVLGGGLTAINRHFISEVQVQVNKTVMGAAYRPEVPIVPARLGAEAGAIGAAISSRDMFLGR
jgi:glucokinase